MTDPIRDLIAAARALVSECDGVYIFRKAQGQKNNQCIVSTQALDDLGAASAKLCDAITAVCEAEAAAEASPEPKPFCGAQHPTRAVVQCQLPAGHIGHHQHAGASHGYSWVQARPEPAAEPSEFARALNFRSVGNTDGASACVVKAIKALAREVRK